MNQLNIESVNKESFEDWLNLGLELWPHYKKEELRKVFRKIFESDKEKAFICFDKSIPVGFANVAIRLDNVPGVKKYPVGYFEGIYTKPEYRKKAIAKDLLKYSEKWLLSKGCIEIASDVELNNIASQKFHKKVGFKEINKLVFFIKKLK